MILFHSVKWKNFLSTGNSWTEINLDTNHMTLISGENGSGKSTILDAITFALFGKPFRKINKPLLINTVNNKNMVSEIEFSTNGHRYKVIRGMKPNIFEIYVDNKKMNQDAANRDYQDILEKQILKSSFKSFTQIVILGSATYTPFMRITPQDRRIVLDDLLDTQVFSVMNFLVKQRLVENRNELSTLEIRNNFLLEKKEFLENQIDSLRNNSNKEKKQLLTSIKELDTRIKDIRNIIKKYVDEYEELEKQLVGNDYIKELLNKLIPLEVQIKSKVRKIGKELEFYTNNDICPTCNQEIELDFRNDIIEKSRNELKKLKTGYDDISKRIGEFNQSLTKYSDIEFQITSLKNRVSVEKVNLNNYEKNRDELVDKLKNFETDTKENLLSNNVSELGSVNKDISDTGDRRRTVLAERENLELALQILKDGGIKSRIIKKYLPVINQTINKYLTVMDFMVNFTLDENFNESIKSRYRDEFSYQNFSEGEKARIDLAILLTWRLIAKLRNSVHTNLLIMDEIFDGSLDSNGSDELVNILKDIVKDSNVFVISHRENMKENFDRTILAKKVNNFSVLEG